MSSSYPPSPIRPAGPPHEPDTRPLHRRKRIWFGAFSAFTFGALVVAMGGNPDPASTTVAAAAPTVRVTTTATTTVTPAPEPAVTVTRTAEPRPAPTVTVTKTVRAAAGSSGSSGSGGTGGGSSHTSSGSSNTGGGTRAGTCSIVSNAGNCYSAGQFCRSGDHGASTTNAAGTPITCRLKSGSWRWTY
ncbi:hypothetical protein AB0F77_09935 [Streptomyces sp. NPDC026672]|uniref:hypothetical protein n=1 Tax=unclassified Streptomyces TaxID=2593676 RepID=UPI0033E6DAE3